MSDKVSAQKLNDDFDSLAATALRIKRERDQAVACLRRTQSALNSLLDSLGALSNPSELDGMGMSVAEQTAILAAHAQAEQLLKDLEG